MILSIKINIMNYMSRSFNRKWFYGRNKYCGIVIYLSFVLFLLTGCEENLRTKVDKDFFVNTRQLKMFVGDEYKLIASPTDGIYNYKWISEDETVVVVDNNGVVKAVGEGNSFIVVEANDILNRIEVFSQIKVPLESVSLSDSRLELLYNDKVTINVSYYPENYNFANDIVWYSENPEIAKVDKGEISVVGEGVTNIVFKSGDIIENVEIDCKYTRPFKGPHILSSDAPCEVLAANFDFGGEGYAFHDNELTNRVGNDNYRRSNGDLRGTPVEIEGNGRNIGYTATNEWLVYTLDVREAGEYIIDVSLSANGSGGQFHIEVNNKDMTGNIAVPNNGSWSNWLWHPSENPPIVNFEKGEQRVKFFIDSASFNLRALRFTKKL
mgnify:CR=1 FL=1